MGKYTWLSIEDSVMRGYIQRNNSKSSKEIAEIIANDKPVELKPHRYDGTAIYQHVCYLRREMKGVA